MTFSPTVVGGGARRCGMVSTGTPWLLPEEVEAQLAEGVSVFSVNRPGGLACCRSQRSAYG